MFELFDYDATLAAISKHAPNFKPKLGIVLGSGLGGFAKHLENPIIIPYKDIPGFQACSISGHGSELYLATVAGIPVACLKGRLHYYEGTSNDAIQILIRTLKLLGCESLLITNAAGAIRTNMRPGDLMMITDHINFQFHSVLAGPNDERFGPRFVGMEDAYNPGLQTQLLNAAKHTETILHQGVYIGVLGPYFETPAEIRAYGMLGADAVGMSTVPEVIVAHHCGLRVGAISVITNMASGMSPEKLSHEQTLRASNQAADQLVKLVLNFIKQYQ